MIGFYLFICIVALIVIYFIGGYNSLVSLRNQVKNAWAQVDVQLKRRYDLIPNLIETVKGYMGHEKETLENITKSRSQALNATGVSEKIQAEQGLDQALNRFNVVVENYPELKANQNFMELQEELTATENKIAFARQAYNDQVYFLNNKIQMFPSNMIAGMFGFGDAAYYRIEENEREAPRVSF